MTSSHTIWLQALWDKLRSSYWFVPALFVAGSASLAIGAVAADKHLRLGAVESGAWFFVSAPSSARAVLTTIATAMMAVVSLTFSMTIVVLTLASSQYGPRLLYNFMRDRSNQVALGTFLASFVYCLLVLRAVSWSGPSPFVPHLATFGGIVLALISVGVLIYFIHHIAQSIQANTVLAHVRQELEEVVRRTIPAEDEQDPVPDDEANRLDDLLGEHGSPVRATGRGTIQTVNFDSLVIWAQRNNAVLRLRHRPGDFIIDGVVIMDVHPGSLCDDEAARYYTLGQRRTLVQDTEFAFNQLVEVAVRALSPGINDPFTAISSVDELSSGLALVMQRAGQPRVIRDSDGVPRLLQKHVTFAGIAAAALDQIRQNGAQHPAVMIRMLDAIAAIAPLARCEEQREVLARHARSICTMAVAAATDEGDRAALRRRFDHALHLLERRPVRSTH